MDEVPGQYITFRHAGLSPVEKNGLKMQFCMHEFSVDRSMFLTIKEREETVAAMAPRKTVVHNVLITTFGLMEGGYASVFSSVITMDDLLS